MRTVFLGLGLLLFTGNSWAKIVPHYFPEGVIQSSDPKEQWAEYLRHVNSLHKAYENDPMMLGNLIPNGMRLDKTIHGRKMTLVLDHHIKLADGRIRFTDFLGNTIITPIQLQVVIDYTLEELEKAIEADFATYGKIRQWALEALGRKNGLDLSMADLQAMLKKSFPENPRYTFNDLLLLPKTLERGDFVPRELHLGYAPTMPGVLGFAYLDTGLVYITPISQVTDHLIGKPQVLMHELVHTNKVLQPLLFSGALDYELEASVPMMLLPEDYIHLLFHHYVSDWRELAHAFFSYDYKRVRKEVIQFDAGGNLFIDGAKFDHYARLLNQVKEEFVKFFPEVIGEFYGKIAFWSAMHDKLVDDRAILWVMMRRKYEPTILGGQVATARWLKTNEPNIKEDYEKAWKLSGTKMDGMGDDGQMTFLRQMAVLVGVDINNEKEVKRLLKELKLKPEELAKMSREEVLQLVGKTLNRRKGEKQ